MDEVSKYINLAIKCLEEEREKVKSERQELEKDKKEWEEFNLKLQQKYNDSENIIELNVGGVNMTTLRSTLTKIPGSMLAAMFSGRHAITNDKQGRAFIDRNPKIFLMVLDYLRTDRLPKFKTGDVEEAFYQEMSYFGLQAVDVVPQHKDLSKLGIASVTASSQHTSHAPTNVLTPEINSYWLSDNNKIQNEWLTFNLGSVKTVGKVRLIFANYEIRGKNFEVLASDNQVDWKSVKKFTTQYPGVEWQEFGGFSVRTQYVRLLFEDRHGPSGGSYILVSGVEIWGC